MKNIEDLLGSQLLGGKVVSYVQRPLLPPGENYGSVIVKITADLVRETTKKTVKCIAKLTPPSPFVWKVFNIPVTFKKEIGVYDVIVPTLNKFSRDCNLGDLGCFAEYIASRVSLDPESRDVDEDAVLLLRDLSEDGFQVCDRFTGFDHKTTLKILQDLAVFHATGIAYRLAKTDDFQQKIKPFLCRGLVQPFAQELIESTCEKIAQALAKDEDCLPLIDRMKANYLNLQTAMVDTPPPNDLFATITHSDLWTNNIMVRFNDGEPESIKFVDFQLVKYDNPANDLLFFLYTSVQLSELQNVDDYIEIYHGHLVDRLAKFNLDVGKFSMANFRREVDFAAEKMQFAHVAFMLNPIFTQKGKAKELSEISGDDDMLQAAEVLHENCYRRWQFLVKDFARRNWI